MPAHPQQTDGVALDLLDEFDRYSMALDGYVGSPFEQRVVAFLHEHGRRSADGTLCMNGSHLMEGVDTELMRNAVEMTGKGRS
jgi:hypothetical protein